MLLMEHALRTARGSVAEEWQSKQYGSLEDVINGKHDE